MKISSGFTYTRRMFAVFDYDKWNERLKELNSRSSSELYFTEGEVWWCVVGLNVGYEENGKGEEFKRPILILRKISRFMFWGLPLSTSEKEGLFYFPIVLKSGIKNVCLLSQIRSFDRSGLMQRIERIDRDTFDQIRKAARDLF